MLNAFFTLCAVIFALAGCALIVREARRQLQTGKPPSRNAHLALGVIATASLLFFTRGLFFLWMGEGHLHDQVHYVLNSKYYDELGQFELYPALIVAAAETERGLHADSFRDMHTYALLPAGEALARAGEIRERFTPRRWRAFVEDVGQFTAMLRNRPNAQRKWQLILWDKGYNATPPWTLVAHAITNWSAIPHRLGSVVYASLDVVLLVILFVVVARTYGLWVCLVAMAFLGCNHLCQFVEIGGGFLRFDWLAALGLGICCLRRERYAWAGILCGYAAAMRVFPVLFAAPLGVLLARDLVIGQSRGAGALKFFAALAVTAASLIGGAAVRFGPGCIQEFREKIAVHVREFGFKRIGLEYAFLYTGTVKDYTGSAGFEDAEQFKQTKQARKSEVAVPLRVTQAAAVAAWLFVLLRNRLRGDEAAMLGFVLVCTMLSPTRYYYIMLLVPVIVCASWLPSGGGLVGLLSIFAAAIGGHLLSLTGVAIEVQQLVNCLLVFAWCLLLLGVTDRCAHGRRSLAQT